MSSARTCNNCGAEIPAGKRSCPNCGRLHVDAKRDRFGSSPVSEPMNKPPAPSAMHSKPQTPTQPDSAGAGKEIPPPGTAKPDSFYAIAPKVYDYCPKCGKIVDGSTCKHCGHKISGGGGRCCPCMVFLVILSWVLTIVLVL